ncbi:alkylated DNA repair dioxygenase [Actibacterium pelagium]|uniref:Alkylated DNA repair dioxygenase n=1 Tax=Actibacterium pelagium TaxID=2029103 RepID=A0A917AL26_9RHOB|nr:alpha-ketoglutarate-dependent dioxygenase AlkB [Actibacterium pelagium]GGE56344.1 alkylated DNA repair dioxygenase [Actibacterium pelagium]
MKKSGKETETAPDLTIRGVELYQQLLNRPAQEALVADLREVIRAAPLFSPMTPYGKPMSVRMTSAGSCGWVSDRSGYRYEPRHPSGVGWPPIPASVLAIWDLVSGTETQPDCCLINFYQEGARMGLHQDKDEASFDYPVVSVSLGDEGMFRIGNVTRGGSTESVWLKSGDVVVMGGDARLIYHGVDRIRPQSSTLLPKGGRINLTLRVVR